jgi:hypothetical protein
MVFLPDGRLCQRTRGKALARWVISAGLGARAGIPPASGPWPQPREDLALGQKAVTNDCRASVFDPFAAKVPENLLEFGLHGLGHETLRPVAKHRVQKIGLLHWPAKFNYRILLHGWRDSLCGLLKTIFDNRIPAGHAAFLNSSPYTRFGYSSQLDPSDHGV